MRYIGTVHITEWSIIEGFAFMPITYNGVDTGFLEIYKIEDKDYG